MGRSSYWISVLGVVAIAGCAEESRDVGGVGTGGSAGGAPGIGGTVGTAGTSGTGGSAPLSPEAARIDAYLDEYVDAYLPADGPGFALAVLGPDGVVLQRTHGMANVEEAIPIGLDTPFELASVSKMFTALAVLMVHEEGGLELDDPLTRFFPEAPASWEGITVHHLLTHQSGLRTTFGVFAGWTDEEVLDWLLNQTLSADPGSEYVYNNAGYVLLALLVERATEQRFEDFMAERVFDPLGMEHSQIVARAPPEVTGGALSYVDSDRINRLERVVGSAGQYSSIEDLMRWEAEMRNLTLISSESLELALTPHVPIGGSCGYGYAWVVCDNPTWSLDMNHTGLRNGFRTMFYRAPSEGLAVIMLSNGDFDGVYAALTENVAYLYLEGEIWHETGSP